MKNKKDTNWLTCPAKDCHATALNNSKERGRFLRRHPHLCQTPESLQAHETYVNRLAEKNA